MPGGPNTTYGWFAMAGTPGPLNSRAHLTARRCLWFSSVWPRISRSSEGTADGFSLDATSPPVLCRNHRLSSSIPRLSCVEKWIASCRRSSTLRLKTNLTLYRSPSSISIALCFILSKMWSSPSEVTSAIAVMPSPAASTAALSTPLSGWFPAASSSLDGNGTLTVTLAPSRPHSSM